MPALILARHAKAEAPRAELDDHSRALTIEGRDAAARLGELLRQRGLIPDLALVSTANRTVQTFKRACASLGEVAVRYEDDLYESARERYINVLSTAGDASTLLVVGHEPTTSHVAAFLAGPGSAKVALQRMAHGMPTAGAAIFEVDGPWDALDARSARLVDVIEGRVL